MLFLSDAEPFMPLLLIPIFVIFIPVLILIVIVIIKNIKKSKAISKKNKKTNFGDYELLFGGSSNIESISVNMSRVSVVVNDLSLVKLEELKNKGMGILVSGNVVKCASDSFAKMVEANQKK